MTSFKLPPTYPSAKLDKKASETFSNKAGKTVEETKIQTQSKERRSRNSRMT